ncbi:dinuclear metal center protein, YbgI/SA1388 family [Ruminococcaceae bacterium YRB3002]|nr:dinuclear metal center protein, YbgI/SA1388 family [Ruminococcaceae bacterium YRB3002]
MSRVTVDDIAIFLEKVFPIENSEEYDNCGLIAGDREQKVSRVVLSLDTTSKAVECAIKNKADLIITHHPLIFGGILSVSEDDYKGRLLRRMTKNDISNYACHTNLDMTDDFGNTAIAEALCGVNVEPLEGVACGVTFEPGYIDYMTLGRFIKVIENSLNCSGCISICDQSRKVGKVFCQGGSFDESSIPAIIDNGIDTVISGEIKHHICVLLDELGISTIIAGHSATEQVYLPKLKKLLEDNFEDVEFILNFNNETGFRKDAPNEN